MTIQEFIEEYKDDLIVGSYGHQKRYAPFDLDAHDYLTFAEKDLTGSPGSHQAVNAIGNVKRSLDCRADTLLHLWGLYKYSKKHDFKFAQKLDSIGRVGLITPSLLKRINTKRNKVEHDYQKPTLGQVRDYLDAATMFVHYTDRYLTLDFGGSELMSEEVIVDWKKPPSKWSFDGKLEKMVARFDLDQPTSTIVIGGGDNRKGKGDFRIEIDARKNFDDYLMALGLWYSLAIE